MSGTIYVEKSNPQNKVRVINMDATDVWFELDSNSPIQCRPRDEFDETYMLPEESAFVQHQWYQNGNKYLWVHTRVDFPDECTVLCLKFEGDDGQYIMGFLNIDVFRTLIDSYTMCTKPVIQVPYPNRVAKDNFERRERREPRDVDPEEKTGLRF